MVDEAERNQCCRLSYLDSSVWAAKSSADYVENVVLGLPVGQGDAKGQESS